MNTATRDKPPASHRRAGLDDFVRAYELALAEKKDVALADFLPAVENPLRGDVLRELVRVDLELAWDRGEPKRLESYRDAFPELFRDPTALQEVAYEEFRLRTEAGEHPTPADYQERFGLPPAQWPTCRVERLKAEATPGAARAGSPFAADWRQELLAGLLDAPGEGLDEAAQSYREYRRGHAADDASALDDWCAAFPGDPAHAGLFRHLHLSDPELALEVAEASPELPRLGHSFLGFQLISELGRGAFGRVYLACQGELAQRFVALKVSTNLHHESQALAQLQHTNIVPIYSSHRFGPFHAFCMPYLGSTTLADVLRELGSRATPPQTGKGLVSTLRGRKGTSRVPTETPAAAEEPAPQTVPGLPASQAQEPATLRMLEQLTHVEAVLWLGSRLAAGLHHAHERGILHRDLKPANILLTDEGQPMLLDFNLSENAKAQDASAALLGGTLGYMAPEHLEAFRGTGVRVDARSDVYALGVILYELLTGHHPFPIQTGPLSTLLPRLIEQRRMLPPPVRRWNRAVSPAVSSIVRHCLEPDTEWRYQSAEQLAEDLQRQLRHEPLRFAPEPSLRERVQKWMHRHPRLASSGTVAVIAAMLFLLLGAGLLANDRRLERAEAVNQLHLFQQDVVRAQTGFVVPKSGEQVAPERLDWAIAKAMAAIDRYHVRNDSRWQERPAVARLSAAEQDQIRENVAELLVWLIHNVGAGVPSGRSLEVSVLESRAEAIPLSAAAAQRLHARQLMFAERFGEALKPLADATQSEPHDAWGWLLTALCYHNLGQDREARSHYQVCIALSPDSPRAYAGRGLTYLREQDYRHALADFDAALRLDPEDTITYVNRALTYQGLKDYTAAIRDLTEALDRGAPETRLYLLRSRVRNQAGQKEEAERDFAEGMRRRPTDANSWIARGFARKDTDPNGALADYDEALKLNPLALDALQNKAHVFSEILNKPEEAIRVLDRVVELKPGYVPSWGGRGVLLARLGKRDQALRDAREALSRDMGAYRRYEVACIYALTSRQEPDDRHEAIRHLAAALRQGFGLDLARGDKDLDPLRALPEFKELLEAATKLSTSAAAPGAQPR